MNEVNTIEGAIGLGLHYKLRYNAYAFFATK